MTDQLAHYPLAPDGVVRHWLACGPVLSPIKDVLEKVVPPEGSPFGQGRRWVVNYWAFDPESAALKKQVYERLPEFAWQPGERRPVLHSPAVSERRWEYAVAEEDNVIDFSTFNFAPQLMQGWLYAAIESERPQRLHTELITIGPARLWLNGKLIKYFADHFSYVAVQRIPVILDLQAGFNDLYVQGDMLGWREARLALGLRFLDRPALSVGVPLGNVPAEQWVAAERGLNAVQIRQFAVPALPVRLALDSNAQPFECKVEVQTPQDPFWTGPLRLDAASQQRQANALKLEPLTERQRIKLLPGQTVELPLTAAILDGMARTPGEHALSVTIKPADGTPQVLHRELWASSVPFSFAPYGDYDSRQAEALSHLANMPYDVPTSMAAVLTGKSQHISSAAIEGACHFLNNRYDCADFYAIGLLALLFRFGDSTALLDKDREQVETALRNFKFWIDEPGIDAMCYFTENHQVLFHVVQYLAGQRYPKQHFTNSGLTGKQQRDRAKPRIEAWILRRLQGNFSEWDSNSYMTLDAFAMLALVEFADSARMREMATAMLHKIFFLIASQSFHGVQGCTHGRCYVSGLKSARAENTSSLQRMAWGMGIFNGETRAAGLLAMTQRYRVPEVIQHIGQDIATPLVTRARSRADFRPQFDMKPGTWDIRTLTRRTPDVMLSATIDYRPGEMGIQEHLWQATLSPEAVVFTTYPGNSQEHGNARPNFWAGSARLPRVGMVDRTVICLYRLEPGVGLGISHAYFPVAMFEEYQIDDQRAFARYGNGYVALWGDGPLRLTTSGKHAGQELRSGGPGLAWLCHVGSASDDGSFAEFIHKVRSNAPQAQGSHVRWQTPEGRVLDFGWQGAMTVDGVAENWDHFPHYANAYTDTPLDAEQMTIRHGGQSLTLDLKRGKVESE